jgi:hypothetical protein
MRLKFGSRVRFFPGKVKSWEWNVPPSHKETNALVVYKTDKILQLMFPESPDFRTQLLKEDFGALKMGWKK